ncbi:hypothetical protein M2150_002479 [Lachnospiraceae bacterium PM6-15]|uniref:Uncharacterized protein n=1 Tax=Ohessyouella blattaphilus TaxID=2949333 RepID=A0ABT1ELA1_9FIRM|nr:hypothetical protein [Ohessyouella blattaphilus]MCP1111476.1 hypothetical protein [Ohessyouella blattaphilus]MCR8564870.1 hypothetical protein [Ohessyouella blattaphilus]
MTALLIIIMIIGGCLLYGFFINKGAVEWACGALILPLVFLGGFLAITLTVQGMPPLIIALVGVGIVVGPTRLFHKVLAKTKALITPLTTRKERGNREEFCQRARSLGQKLEGDAFRLYDLAETPIVEEPVHRKTVKKKPAPQKRVLQKQVSPKPVPKRPVAKEKSGSQEMYEKAKYLFEKGQYRLAYELFKHAMPELTDFRTLQELVCYKRRCLEKLNGQEQEYKTGRTQS